MFGPFVGASVLDVVVSFFTSLLMHSQPQSGHFMKEILKKSATLAHRTQGSFCFVLGLDIGVAFQLLWVLLRYLFNAYFCTLICLPAALYSSIWGPTNGLGSEADCVLLGIICSFASSSPDLESKTIHFGHPEIPLFGFSRTQKHRYTPTHTHTHAHTRTRTHTHTHTLTVE